SKPRRSDVGEIASELMRWLEQHRITYKYDVETAHAMGTDNGLEREDVGGQVDLMIVLGGDGTLLAAARAVAGRNMPLLAVNLGGLGFLMTTGMHELRGVLEAVFAGRYEIQCRTMVRGELVRGDDVVAVYDALNDVVVNKAEMARVIDMDAYVDG